MLSDTSHSPLYRKIEETISRNDFRSAEHLIEKHREELAQDEGQTLRTLVEQKQKANVRANRHRQRQRRWDRCLRQHPIHSVLVSKEGILIGLVILLLALIFINLLYMSVFYYHLRSGVGNPQRTLSGDIITALILLIASVFCGVASTTHEPQKSEKKGYTVTNIIFALVGSSMLISIIWTFAHGGY